MSELKFSLPNNVPGASPPNMGWVFTGNKPMTESDVESLCAFLEDSGHGSVDPRDLVIDSLSTVGKHDYFYTSYWYQQTGNQPPGGAGSEVYETKRVGEGVRFAKHDIWYYPSNSPYMVWGIPPDCGAYHSHDMGGGHFSNIAGPAPKSEAEALLGGGYYRWSKNKELYMIEGGAE